MKNVLFPILAIGALAFIALRRTTFARNLSFVFRDIALRGRLLSPKIQITIGIQNPSNQTATIRSIVAKVRFNGAEFANISTFQTIKVLPNSESPLVITAEPSILGVFDTVKKLLKDGLKKGTINIDGTANIDNIQVPININQVL